MIVRTDLDHKRAEKLAKRNPKKERMRPAPSFAASPGAATSAPAEPSAIPASDEAVPAE
jgi:hypothetical protein